MSTTSSRLPLSVPNIVLIGGSFAGAVATIVLGNWFGAVLLIALGGGGLLSALLARRCRRQRLAAHQRDRIPRRAGCAASPCHGFAVVGAWALALSTLELVAATIYVGAVTLTTSVNGAGGSVAFTFTRATMVGGVLEAIAALQLFVLALVWGIANTRAVKRG